MAYNTFTPPVNPQMPMEPKSQPRLLSPNMGAGYPTFLPDGINVVLKQVTLNFAVLTQANFTAIDTFMTANLGKYFYYTLIDEAYPRLWVMSGRTRRVLATVWEYDVSLSEQPPL